MKLNYPGVPVYMNGRNWYVPSLGTRDFIDNYDQLTSVTADMPGKELIEKFGPIVIKAINRNYPDVTLDALLDMSDVYTFTQCIRAVQNASGMTPVTETAEGE